MGWATHRSGRGSALASATGLALLAALLITGHVDADATLTVAVVGASSEATGDGGSDECDAPLTDSATCSAASSGSEDGASGSASSTVTGVLGFDDLGFLTTVSANGSAGGAAQASATRAAYGESDAVAWAHFEVERKVVVLVQGSLGIQGNGATTCSAVRIHQGEGSTVFDIRAPGSDCGEGGTFASSLDERVELPAGTYQLELRAYAGSRVLPGDGSADSQATFDLDVELLTCDNEYTDGPDLVSGTAGDDVLCGGPGDDDIFGLGGNDRIYGGDGNDTIEGGDGEDTIDAGPGGDTFVDGGPGDDTMWGGQGHDGSLVASGMSFTGGDGDDVLFGGDGIDDMSGGPGGDIVHGGAGTDFLNGDDGPDMLFGEDGGDSLYGGAGNDEIDGGPGDEVGQQGRLSGIDGGSGDDVLMGRGGDDLIEGGGGADLISGGVGADKVRGQAGDDTLAGGSGRDVLNGGRGPDDLHARDTVQDTVLGGPGRDEAAVDRRDSVSGVELVRR